MISVSQAGLIKRLLVGLSGHRNDSQTRAVFRTKAVTDVSQNNFETDPDNSAIIPEDFGIPRCEPHSADSDE